MSWWQNLKQSLKNTSSKISSGISNALRRRVIDEESLQEIEETLLLCDMGVKVTDELIKKLKKQKFQQDVSDEELKDWLRENIQTMLAPYEKELQVTNKPHVILLSGVNGSGKTTSIAKLAQNFVDQGLKVAIVAGDTFRAAAIEQIDVWATRLGVHCYSKTIGSDAASLVYTALQDAINKELDVLLIDTAGRLQNKEPLMAELAKIIRVIQKLLPDAPHNNILVLDATVGQNAHSQFELFNKVHPIDGLIITKLDGTAKGGVVLSLTANYQVPIFALGVGEKSTDLLPFNAQSFADGLV